MAGVFTAFGEKHNDFALALYGQLRRPAGNLFFSPLAIRVAFGPAYAGARGETAAQMSKALRFEPSDESLHVAFAETIRRLDTAREGEDQLHLANSLWGQAGGPFLPEFVDRVSRYHGGDLNLVDFRRNPEAARSTINRWAEDKTRQKIRELIPRGTLTSDTRLTLVSAVHFKGTWVLPFRKADTRDEPFYLEGGLEVQAPLMSRPTEVQYLRAEGFQAVDLGYRGGYLSMLVLLPDEMDGLPDLEARLTPAMLHDCVAKLRARVVKLTIPRLKVSGSIELGSQLRALGMPLAFTRFQADFSGINGRVPPHDESLFVSRVFHEARVEVTEEGTEAEAATAVFASKSSGRAPAVPVFRADRPFLFAIRDRRSTAIIFLGRVADPVRAA